MYSEDIYGILLEKCPQDNRSIHYLKRYVKFVSMCQMSNINLPDGTYTENHHICPKGKNWFPHLRCFTSFPWNKAVLTARQHYIAHQLLALSLGGSMWYALKCMIESKRRKDICRDYHTPSRVYERAKIESSSYLKGVPKSEDHKKKIGDAHRGMKKKYSQEWLDAHSKRMKDLHTGVPKSEEHKKKIGEGRRGKKHSEETLSKMRDRDFSEDHRNKISQAYQNRPVVTCPHCGVSSKNSANMKRYHFDKCKKAPE